ncbi:MAG: SDR family oxidoreductase [Phycisphaerales bacterium]
MNTPLKDKIAIVTGASSGIGEATARTLAAHGAKVALAARRLDRLQSLEREINDAGSGSAIAVETDVRNRDHLKRFIEQMREAFGDHVDILINNAGVMPVSPIEAGRTDDWDRMIDVNIKGALYAIDAVLPGMIERSHGHIVNVSSVAGRNIFPGNVVYCATKHALHVISEGLRAELAQADPPRAGIRITTISPGIVDTELPDSTTDEERREQIRQYYQSVETPLTSEDIARSILFALQSPPHVNVNEILLRPLAQAR